MSPPRGDLGAQTLECAYFGAEALFNPCTLGSMQNILTDHMRVFVAGDVSIQSLSTAAEAERVDRDRARRVLMVLSQWEPGRGSMGELRARVQQLL